MLNGAASNDDSKITRLEIKQATMETLIAGETDNLKKDVASIKTDVNSIKKSVEDIQAKIIFSHGYIMAMRFLGGILGGVIIALLVYIYQQDKKAQTSLHKEVEVARDEIHRAGKGKN